MTARAQLADIVALLLRERGITAATLAYRLGESRNAPTATGGTVTKAATSFYRALRGAGPWPPGKVELLVKTLKPGESAEAIIRKLYPDASRSEPAGRRRGPSPAKVEALELVGNPDRGALDRLRALINEHMA